MLVISTPHVWKACVEMPKYLQQRYRVWYAVLDIPKDVRPKLGGKPRFVQSLKTESLSEAEILVLPLIAEWKALIQEARGQTTPSSADLVAKALHWRDELRRAQDDQHEHSVLASIVDDELWKLNETDPKAAKIAAKISDGQSYPLDRDIDAWLAPQTVEQKTKDMKRADARRFVARFKLSHEVTRQALQNWVHHLQVSDELSTATVSRIRKLADLDGQLLWQSGLAAGQPSLLLGRPVYEAPDMDDATTGKTPIIFGDFASGYTIADHTGFSVMRDDYTGAANGIVKLHARRRVGGRVTLGEALVKLKLAA